MFITENVIFWKSLCRKWHPFHMPTVDTIYPFSFYLELLTPKRLNELSVSRCGCLTVSALDCGASGPVSSPGRVVFLGKILYSHSAFPTQVYKWVPANLMLGDNPAMD